MREKTIYALGFFDGVHIGHQALLTACRELAQKHSCATGAVTFDRHPSTMVLGAPLPLLYSDTQRRELLRRYGAEQIVFLHFDDSMMRRSWQDFLKMLITDLNAAGFVCGDDFRFGYRGEGDAEILKNFCAEHGLACAIVPEQIVNGQRVSSTAIRTALTQGNIETVNALLGRRHALTGTVTYGRGLGHTIGIPTANFAIESGILEPCHGVYATKVTLAGVSYPAVTNIGSRPTVGGHQIRTETWILDFDGQLYDQELTVQLCAYLRPEQKFSSLDELIAQIHRDAAQAKDLL